MKILLTGASGFIGSHIHTALQQQQHQLICADRHHGVDFGQMLSPEDWQPLLQDVDAVINCVGIIFETRQQSFIKLHQQAPAALFQACACEGVNKVIQISALGADENAFTPYQLTKKAAEDRLRALPLQWFILRPSLVVGPGSSSLKAFQRMARMPLLALADGGRQKIQPVHIDDLLAAVLKCLRSEQAGLTLDIVGPRAMSFAEWLQLIRHTQGKGRLHIIPVPFQLMLPLAHLGRWVMPLMHPDNLKMLQQGNTANPAPLRNFLQRNLTAPEAALAAGG